MVPPARRTRCKDRTDLALFNRFPDRRSLGTYGGSFNPAGVQVVKKGLKTAALDGFAAASQETGGCVSSYINNVLD